MLVDDSHLLSDDVLGRMTWIAEQCDELGARGSSPPGDRRDRWANWRGSKRRWSVRPGPAT